MEIMADIDKIKSDINTLYELSEEFMSNDKSVQCMGTKGRRSQSLKKFDEPTLLTDVDHKGIGGKERIIHK